MRPRHANDKVPVGLQHVGRFVGDPFCRSHRVWPTVTVLPCENLGRVARAMHTASSDQGKRRPLYIHTTQRVLIQRQGKWAKVMVAGRCKDHTALSDQGGPYTYTLHGAYYLKDRESRPKVWYRVVARIIQLYQIKAALLHTHDTVPTT